MFEMFSISVEMLEKPELEELSQECGLAHAGALVNEGKFVQALAAYGAIETPQSAFNSAQVWFVCTFFVAVRVIGLHTRGQFYTVTSNTRHPIASFGRCDLNKGPITWRKFGAHGGICIIAG